MMKLRHYHRGDFAKLEEFKLPDDQTRFTALPEKALQECESDPDRYPIVIEAREGPVGLFVLCSGSGEGSDIFNKSGEFYGDEEDLVYQWTRIDQLSSIDVRPKFLYETLKQLPHDVQHQVINNV